LWLPQRVTADPDRHGVADSPGCHPARRQSLIIAEPLPAEAYAAVRSGCDHPNAAYRASLAGATASAQHLYLALAGRVDDTGRALNVFNAPDLVVVRNESTRPIRSVSRGVMLKAASSSPSNGSAPRPRSASSRSRSATARGGRTT
jgi:hypothetical protein